MGISYFAYVCILPLLSPTPTPQFNYINNISEERFMMHILCTSLQFCVARY
jgi:hypothetical protein